jgi:polar amino acid transport system permease protein
VYFGLPALGLRLSPETASIIAMVINLSAYATEIIRAGIEATPKGQIEAGMSLALTPRQIFTHVVLPPALRKVWPALVSQIIIVMLGSAVCGQISTEELSHAANLIQSRNFRAFEAFIIATLTYLMLAMALRRLLNWLGPRFLFGR